MIKNSWFLLFILFSLNTLGQKSWNAKDVIKLEDADIYLEITDYRSALDKYLPLYEKYGNVEDMDYKIGLCYNGLGQMEEAREFFDRAKDLDYADAYFQLALYHHSIEEFEVSIALLEAYKNIDGSKSYDQFETDRMIQIAQRADNMMRNPVNVALYNAGKSINSEYDDYGPLITGDETMMAFTSRREGSTGNKRDPYGDFLEDIYFSFKVDDKWQNAVNAGEPLNSSTHDAAVGMSTDGTTLITYRTNKDLTAGDLYMSRDVNKIWTEPEIMDKAINSNHQEASASLTQDERVIYFSSNRPEGHGGMDIYRIVRLGNNEWSKPMNLGPTINTAFDEDAPFIHPNGKTLYFSSKGHKTMGGYDIFKSSLGEEYWSTPENLGYPVNTVGNDIFFVLASDGKRGYYSSLRSEGYGGHDVYSVSFENSLESLRIVKGNISNDKGDNLTASISLLDEDDNEVGIYNTNPLSGNYIIILPPDLNFSYLISSEGYEEIKGDLFYQGGTNIKERNQDHLLKPIIEQ